MFSANKSGLIPIDTPVLFGLIFLLLTMALFVIMTRKFRGNRIKILSFWSLAWLALAAAFFGTGVFGRVVDVSNINTKTYTRKELTEDLGQLEKCILEENPLYFADKNELKQLFLSAYDEIKDGMTELEFYHLVNPIIVAVGCGHTNLSVSEALDELPLLQKVVGYTKHVTPADTTFDGDAVVLTDGAGFSTTGHFCALVKHHNLGTLVGSETGATYVCTDSSKDTVINNTRLRLHYSTLVYRVAVDGMSEHEGVKPDIRIAPTIEDILNERDVQMEAALQFLKLR
ncbi:MAG: S41 family peptidase [Bacillota bacterium]